MDISTFDFIVGSTNISACSQKYYHSNRLKILTHMKFFLCFHFFTCSLNHLMYPILPHTQFTYITVSKKGISGCFTIH